MMQHIQLNMVTDSELDILIFIISIVLGEYIAYKLMKRKNESDIKTLVLSGIILLFLFSCFVFA